MEGMRSLVAVLITALIVLGVLPATAEDAPSPGSSASPSPSAASPDPTSSEPAPTPAVYPVFNEPRPAAPDPRINAELTRLVAEVPAGETISASLFVVAPGYPFVDALLAAHARGVAVRVVLDSADGQSAATNEAVDQTHDKLAAVLGSDPAAPSFIVRCTAACISKEPDSINHNKFVLMSRSGELSDVVFQSTANVRSDGSGDGAWNAATVSSGSPELFASYLTYFGNLASRMDVPDGDYGGTVQPARSVERWTPHYFPRTDGVDPVAKTLEKVDCRLIPTKVEVMAAFFTRVKVRNRLNDLAAAGCDVRVIARSDTITGEFCNSLAAPVAVRLSDRPTPTSVGIHGKYLIISGGFGGSERRIVWMGSQNFTRNALVRNDETFLLIEDAALHAQFADNFERIWSHPSVTPGCNRAGATSTEAIEEEANEEVTVLIKQSQTVALPLPRALRTKRTRLVTTRTAQGQPLTTTVRCRVRGTAQKMRERRICVVKKPRTAPTVVLAPKRRTGLRVRIVQQAIGTATLEPFERQRTYTFRRR